MTDPTAPLDGPRACGVYELPAVLDLANYVLRTLWVAPGQPPRPPTIGFDFPHVFNSDNLLNIRVVMHHARAVAAVGIYPTKVRTSRGSLDVGGISVLVTHPDYRRRGLGTAVMEDAHKRMREAGMSVALLSTRIQDWYRKLGWESAGAERSFVFDRGNIDLLPPPAGMEVAEDWRPWTAELADLHNNEPLTTLRDAARFALLAECKAPRIFVALRYGSPIAYAAVSDSSVREYAGPVDAVAALLRSVFERIDNPDARTSLRAPGQRATPEMHLSAPDASDGLPALLLRLRIPHSFGYQGMIKILDAPRLLKSLGLDAISLCDSGERMVLERGAEKIDLSERELVRLIFGPERPSDFARDVLPAPFHVWPMDRV
jgi:ribosomal protein S18 acetylase RimI-like enzyme